MKHDNLEVAERHLRAAHDALMAEAQLIIGDDWPVMDALSLTADALSEVRGAIGLRLPERPIIDRRAG